MSRAKAAAALLPDNLSDLMSRGRAPVRDPGAPDVTAQAQLQRFLQDKLGITPMEAMIGGGGLLGTAAIGGLAGADGGDAIATGALGGAIAASPEIFNAVRNPKFRTKGLGRGELVKLVAAGAGSGAGTSVLLDALGLTNQ